MQCSPTDIKADIAALDLSLILADTGTVGRYTLAKDGHGGRTATWVGTTTIPCMVTDVDTPMQPTPVGSRLRDAGAHYELKVTSGVFLNQHDRVTVNSVLYSVQSESERDTLSVFNVYWCQIVSEPNEALP